MEEVKVNLDTMSGVGKVKKIAGREYTILPVNIRDMHYIIGDGDTDEKLIIVDKKNLEDGKEDLSWQLFGYNITDSKKKKSFLYVLNHYVFYKNVPMTEELLIEHNWSFKEIGEFLYTWSQISD